MEGVGQGEDECKDVDDDDEEDGRLDLHAGAERVDDDDEAIHGDDRQRQG